MPSLPGVKINSAPRAASSFLRSTLIVSGMTSASLYPLAAQTKARPIPVLPLVGSRMTVSGPIRPSVSAAWTMLKPIRSLTLERGLKDSSLASTVASIPALTLFNLTRGVCPTVWVISS